MYFLLFSFFSFYFSKLENACSHSKSRIDFHKIWAKDLTWLNDKIVCLYTTKLREGMASKAILTVCFRQNVQFYANG